jgi:hypothetical protein
MYGRMRSVRDNFLAVQTALDMVECSTNNCCEDLLPSSVMSSIIDPTDNEITGGISELDHLELGRAGRKCSGGEDVDWTRPPAASRTFCISSDVFQLVRGSFCGSQVPTHDVLDQNVMLEVRGEGLGDAREWTLEQMDTYCHADRGDSRGKHSERHSNRWRNSNSTQTSTAAPVGRQRGRHQGRPS